MAATGNEQHPELVLLIVLETDRQEANQAIREAGLSPLHNIRLVHQVEEIPLLGTGKTDYTRINKMINESFSWYLSKLASNLVLLISALFIILILLHRKRT